MVPASLPAASAVCRARVLISPRVFCRHKSLSAAIERGRQSSEAATGPRTRSTRQNSRNDSNPFYDDHGRAREPDRRPKPAKRTPFEQTTKIEPGRNDWSCGKCGFENFRRNKTCGGCGADQDGNVPDQPRGKNTATQRDNSGDWTCSCGENNFAKRSKCYGCGKEKRAVPKPKGSRDHAGEWNCSCGQVNFARSIKCYRCGREKRDNAGEWTCSCGENNFGRRIKCYGCGKDKSEVTEARDAEFGKQRRERDEEPRAPREYPREPESRSSRQSESGRDRGDIRDARRENTRSFGDRPTRQRDSERQSPRQSDRQREYRPENLPYTTAASEFLYGYSSVLAALKAGRRKLYKLYVHKERGLNNEGATSLLLRAKQAKVDVREVGDDYLPLLDKASSGRPHNGFILESSPLPQPPITQLGPSTPGSTFNVVLDSQTREDREVNGTATTYPCMPSDWNRHPLVLYIDGVLDEGNLGAIARSAYFLGVDAIATPTRQSAPWSHISIKASAGAAEALPIFKVAKPADFLSQSARAGWRIYASDAIPDEPTNLSDPTPALFKSDEPKEQSSAIIFSHARGNKRLLSGHSPLLAHPCILMMGAEGTGLRQSLLNHANYKVGIAAGRRVDEVGVDSLNVSVAASLLAFEFLKKPIVLPGKEAVKPMMDQVLF